MNFRNQPEAATHKSESVVVCWQRIGSFSCFKADVQVGSLLWTRVQITV